MFQYKIITHDPTDKDTYLEGFIELYKSIFSRKPFFEKFTDQQITAIYEDYSQQGNIFILVFVLKEEKVLQNNDVCNQDNTKLIGFSAGKPLQRCNQDIISLLTKTMPVDSTFYNADLGVLPDYRGNTLGFTMTEQRIAFATEHSYSHIVMRTSESESMSSPIYKKLGFTVIENIYQNVQHQRMSNDISKTDRRVFFVKKIN